jgi:hypothetical protein
MRVAPLYGDIAKIVTNIKRATSANINTNIAKRTVAAVIETNMKVTARIARRIGNADMTALADQEKVKRKSHVTLQN